MTSDPNPLFAESDRVELARVDAVVASLSPYYETVQIFVSRHMTVEDVSIGREMSDTRTINRGVGNWFARFGQVRAWLIQQDECERIEARKDKE
jgi:hypothetical protein